MRRMIRGLALALVAMAPAVQASELRLSTESGAVWQTRNDVRIPGDDGTRIAFDDVNGSGPFAFIRISLDYDFAERHGLRLVYAPLRIQERGELGESAEFADERFEPGGVEGTYQFNAHRFTYRYLLRDNPRWQLRVGLTVLVRDAEVRLVQDGARGRNTDVGLVPLLHLAGSYRMSERWTLGFDVDGLVAPQGRALDLGVRAEYAIDNHWDVFTGYRALDGGVDNDEVFNFAQFNYAVIGADYLF